MFTSKIITMFTNIKKSHVDNSTQFQLTALLETPPSPLQSGLWQYEQLYICNTSFHWHHMDASFLCWAAYFSFYYCVPQAEFQWLYMSIRVYHTPKTRSGMDRGVVLIVRAVPSTPLLGSASLSLNLPVMIWRYDCVLLTHLLYLKIK